MFPAAFLRRVSYIYTIMGFGLNKPHARRMGITAALGLLTSVAAPVFASVIDRPFFRSHGIVVVFGSDDFSENGGNGPVAYDFHVLDNATPDAPSPDLIGDDGHTINFNANQYNPISDGSDSGWEYQIQNQLFGGNFISAGPHQTLDPNDAYTPFGLDDTTDIDLLGGGGRASRFYVVSNVPFDIYGQASNLTATGAFAALGYENIRYRLRITVSGGGGANQWGARAQDPSTGGSGILIGGAGLWTLDDLSSGPTKVFDGGRRTAAAAGSIFQQAVSFQSRYNLRQGGINGNNYDFSMGTGTLGADVTYTVYTP